MRSGFDDLFGNIFGGGSFPPETPRYRPKSALRQECAQKGHNYQVHGRTNPTKIACSRCLVSWGIGPRTEPGE